jgi:NAD(P)H-hydrate epimerase
MIKYDLNQPELKQETGMKEWTGDNTQAFAVMSRQAVREFDRRVIDLLKIPGVVLMENAGRSCAELILNELEGIDEPHVCIFCGSGNNGGDGFVIARHLFNQGVRVEVVLCADRAKVQGDAKVNLTVCEAINVPIDVVDIESPTVYRQLQQFVLGCDLLVDALLGTGLTGDLKSPMALLISSLNAHNIPIIAVDIPSGLDCDTGLPLPVCIEAKATVTFAAIKKGFVECAESRTATGRVFVADIGILPSIFEQR